MRKSVLLQKHSAINNGSNRRHQTQKQGTKISPPGQQLNLEARSKAGCYLLICQEISSHECSHEVFLLVNKLLEVIVDLF